MGTVKRVSVWFQRKRKGKQWKRKRKSAVSLVSVETEGGMLDPRSV